jgi:hypothetical protein
MKSSIHIDEFLTCNLKTNVRSIEDKFLVVFLPNPRSDETLGAEAADDSVLVGQTITASKIGCYRVAIWEAINFSNTIGWPQRILCSYR